MELGVKLYDSLVECVLVDQSFFLKKPHSLCHGFEVVLLCPTLVADALALLQLCLNVHQFLNSIRLVCCDGLDGRDKPDVLSECGEYLLFLKLVTDTVRPDELRSSGRQIAEPSTAFFDGNAVLLHELVREIFKAGGTVQHRRNLFLQSVFHGFKLLLPGLLSSCGEGCVHGQVSIGRVCAPNTQLHSRALSSR